MRIWLALGALNGFIGVAMGAAAAHALSASLDEAAVGLVRTASLYQCLHALALVGVAALVRDRGTLRLDFAGLAFALGCAAFSGGLYARAFLDLPVGPLIPAGGTCLLLGWALLFAAAFGRR
ncbi:MAG: DUF423 domain-containing protein [Alphaproteobacteria bacterium]|nr:DUF423 domain-containing protein [Alphaproteobacteria bacterium]